MAGYWYRFATDHSLSNLLEEFQPDVVNNHYLNVVAEISQRSIERFSRSIPWIISLHGGDVDGEPFLSSGNMQRFIQLSQHANGITACSAFLSSQAEELVPKIKEKIRVIHNGVNFKLFSSAKSQASEFQYIFAVGQLSPHKGFDLLIHAFSEVAKKYPKLQLWIAGAGSMRRELDLIIIENNLFDQVKMIGKVDEIHVASLMAGSLFIAMPSRREPFGMVALEGMAAGKPVLASPVGGLTEFLPVPPNRFVNVELANWILALDEWAGLAMQGKLKAGNNLQEAQLRDWSNISQQYLQVYQNAMAHG